MLKVIYLAGVIFFFSCDAWRGIYGFMFLLWLFYFSIISSTSKTTFYNYGWEPQLLETVFGHVSLCFLSSIQTGFSQKLNFSHHILVVLVDNHPHLGLPGPLPVGPNVCMYLPIV
jgi:hypothetical protein